MPSNIEIYATKAIQAIETVFETEYHNTLGIPKPQIKMLLPDDANYTTGEYFIEVRDNTWQIHLNFGKLPISFKEFEDEVKVLTRHEIEHYMCCPFDVITHLRMVKCIIDVYNKEFSNLNIDILKACGSISNQAADIIVDSKNYFRHPQETLRSEIDWIKKGANIKTAPRYGKLMFLTKEALWGSSLEIKETDNELLDVVYELASKFKENGIEDKASFLEKTKAYTRTFLNLYKKDRIERENDNDNPQQGSHPQQGSLEITMPKPKDGDKNGSTFIFANPDKIKEAIKALAEETNVQNFSDILSAAGIHFNSESEKHKLWFSIQGTDMIPIEEYTNSGNKEKYTFPSTWRIGDPIETLDITLSLMTSPKILPGLTTKKWELSTRDTKGVEKKQRDLLLVLDTSGSMGCVLNEKDNMHQAVLAAYGILSYFESVKSKVALIEFDKTIRERITWTDNYDTIRNSLLVNGSNGTAFPLWTIKSVLEQSSNELVTVLITDGDLSNISETVDYFREYLYNDNKLYIFLLGESKSIQCYIILKDIGAKIYNANKAKDFCDMVISDLD